jgi:hypothetical protein
VDTCVYIDGFNFYYGAVKDTPHKWLDFKDLVSKKLSQIGPHYNIISIKYFTAYVSSPPYDPQQTQRQETYIRALEDCIPELEVILGKFRPRKFWAPLANGYPHTQVPRSHRNDSWQMKSVVHGQRTDSHVSAFVTRPEEKQSDVNLGVHMVQDAWELNYQAAVVLSNDSDLKEPMHIVKDRLARQVILLTPPKFRRHRHADLLLNATDARTIGTTELAASQLPDPTPGRHIHKPASW